MRKSSSLIEDYLETKEGFKGTLLSKSHPQGDLRPALRSPRNATSDGESWALERRAGT